MMLRPAFPVASESTRMLPSSSRGFSSRDSLRGVQFLHKLDVALLSGTLAVALLLHTKGPK